MPEVIALQHATLIDGTGAAPVPDATILVADGRFSAAGPAASVEVSADAEVRDCSDAYVIPGLMDANIHLVGGPEQGGRPRRVRSRTDGRNRSGDVRQ